MKPAALLQALADSNVLWCLGVFFLVFGLALALPAGAEEPEHWPPCGEPGADARCPAPARMPGELLTPRLALVCEVAGHCLLLWPDGRTTETAAPLTLEPEPLPRQPPPRTAPELQCTP